MAAAAAATAAPEPTGTPVAAVAGPTEDKERAGLQRRHVASPSS
jgi:hypothetical protein